MRLFVLVLVLASCCAFGAEAQTAVAPSPYILPDWSSLAKTLMRFHAIDPADDKVIDDYGAITECKLYQAFYKDDFKWNQVRNALRADIRDNGAAFPAAYGYLFEVKLDRYDFNEKLFRIDSHTAINNINAFRLLKTPNETCGMTRIQHIPSTFRAQLAAPVFIPGLPLTPEEAQGLLQRMTAAGNAERKIYARFDLDIVYVEPVANTLSGPPVAPAHDPHTLIANDSPQRKRINITDAWPLDSRLSAVDFFEDEALTKPIYSFRP